LVPYFDSGAYNILPLTEFFVAKFAASLHKPIDSIPEELIAVLQAHDWPGNIRELQNFIERAVLFSPGSVLRLPLDPKQRVPQAVNGNSESVSCTLAEADRENILETLRQTDWLIGGQAGAANRLGLPRTTLIYKVRKLGIETRRSLARPIRQSADEPCHAVANC
jgi:DNA-binding NtrC family response regulator